MTINRTTPLILDSNEYIFGLSGTKPSCVQLLNYLNMFQVYVPLMVVREVERNLELMYGLGSAFFRLIIPQKNITVVWSPPAESVVLAYVERGFSKEDATIAATAEAIDVKYLISENRDFLQQATDIPFQVINAQVALDLMADILPR